MIIKSGTYRNIDWWIKLTPQLVTCAYLDVSGFLHLNGDSEVCDDCIRCPGGITYADYGLQDMNYETIRPNSWIVGWDYAHDYEFWNMTDIPFDKMPTLAQVEDNIHGAIGSIYA